MPSTRTIGNLYGAAPESSFALMPDGEYQNGIVIGLITVERNITSSSLRNNQFSQSMLGLAANQWMASQHTTASSINSSASSSCAPALSSEKKLQIRSRSAMAWLE
jgi:hypothetical protein